MLHYQHHLHYINIVFPLFLFVTKISIFKMSIHQYNMYFATTCLGTVNLILYSAAKFSSFKFISVVYYILGWPFVMEM